MMAATNFATGNAGVRFYMDSSCRLLPINLLLLAKRSILLVATRDPGMIHYPCFSYHLPRLHQMTQRRFEHLAWNGYAHASPRAGPCLHTRSIRSRFHDAANRRQVTVRRLRARAAEGVPCFIQDIETGADVRQVPIAQTGPRSPAAWATFSTDGKSRGPSMILLLRPDINHEPSRYDPSSAIRKD